MDPLIRLVYKKMKIIEGTYESTPAKYRAQELNVNGHVRRQARSSFAESDISPTVFPGERKFAQTAATRDAS
jgi:hypothetical protein